MSIIPLLVSFSAWTCLPTQRHLGVHNLISADWFNSHVFSRLPHHSNVKQCTTVVLKWWNYLSMKMLHCWIVQLANGQADCKQHFPFSFVTVFCSQVLIIHMTGLFSSQTNIFSFLQYAYFTCSDHAIFPFLTKPFPSILQHYSSPNSPSLYMMFLGMPYSLVNLLHTRTVRYKHFYNLPTAIQPHANQRIITPLCKVTSKTFDLCI